MKINARRASNLHSRVALTTLGGAAASLGDRDRWFPSCCGAWVSSRSALAKNSHRFHHPGAAIAGAIGHRVGAQHTRLESSKTPVDPLADRAVTLTLNSVCQSTRAECCHYR